MTNADFIAGYHAGYQAAVEHLNTVPGLVLPGNVAAILGDDTRRAGLAESAAAEHAAPVLAELNATLAGDVERPALGEVARDADGNPRETGVFISDGTEKGTDDETVTP